MRTDSYFAHRPPVSWTFFFWLPCSLVWLMVDQGRYRGAAPLGPCGQWSLCVRHVRALRRAVPFIPRCPCAHAASRRSWCRTATDECGAEHSSTAQPTPRDQTPESGSLGNWGRGWKTVLKTLSKLAQSRRTAGKAGGRRQIDMNHHITGTTRTPDRRAAAVSGSRTASSLCKTGVMPWPGAMP